MKEIKPGIRWKTYIGGRLIFDRAPVIEQGEPQIAEDARRKRDGDIAITRLRAYTGAADSLTKRSWTCTWELVSGTDLGHLNAITAVRGIVDFCPWTDEYEAFWVAEGATFGGYLQRRSALAVVPSAHLPTPNAATEFAPHLYVWDATNGEWDEDVDLALGSPTADYRTPWDTSDDRVAGTGGEQALIVYTPVYRVRIAANQPTYIEASSEHFALRVEE